MTLDDVLCLSLHDVIHSPSKAESLLAALTSEQILVIEQTIGKLKKRKLNTNEPMTEIKDGIEWVSFVYSHNRVLKRYSIRTDLQLVDISVLDDKFKAENCVYPRANLPKEQYTGNRWNYETECNQLGWKLAWLNKDEIAGKRGLIQRAVDSYRNRYPNMRSRRVARQEKLLNGTLRKRKHKDIDTLESIIQPVNHPKTIAIDDTNNQRVRIKINIESVSLDEINMEFRKANCPFPRVMNIAKPTVNNTRWIEETMCNELAWKLAWLNPRHLAGKKNMLQRALDIYRSKFMPELQPRKGSRRLPRIDTLSPVTTEPLDFTDCFSLDDDGQECISSYSSTTTTPSPAADLFDQFISNDDDYFCLDMKPYHELNVIF